MAHPVTFVREFNDALDEAIVTYLRADLASHDVIEWARDGEWLPYLDGLCSSLVSPDGETSPRTAVARFSALLELATPEMRAKATLLFRENVLELMRNLDVQGLPPTRQDLFEMGRGHSPEGLAELVRTCVGCLVDTMYSSLRTVASDPPACWGWNIRIGDPGLYVSEDMLDVAISRLPSSLRDIAYDLYLIDMNSGIETVPSAHLLSDEALAADAAASCELSEAPSYGTEFYPPDYSPDELVELARDSPRLFGGEDRASWPELAGAWDKVAAPAASPAQLAESASALARELDASETPEVGRRR